MKKLTTFSAVVLCSVMNAQLQYCKPSFQYGADSNMIRNVTFGALITHRRIRQDLLLFMKISLHYQLIFRQETLIRSL